MARLSVTFSLDAERLAKLDRMAAAQGTNRSEIIKVLIDETDEDAEPLPSYEGYGAKKPVQHPATGEDSVQAAKKAYVTIFDCPGCGRETEERPVSGSCSACRANKPVQLFKRGPGLKKA